MTCPFLVSVSWSLGVLSSMWTSKGGHAAQVFEPVVTIIARTADQGHSSRHPLEKCMGLPHGFLSSEGTCIRTDPPPEAPASGQWPKEKTSSHLQGQLSSWMAPLSPVKGTSQALSLKKWQLGFPKLSGNSKRKSTRTRNRDLGPTASFSLSVKLLTSRGLSFSIDEAEFYLTAHN